MSLNAFSKLVDLLRKDIEPNKRKSRQSTSGNEPVSAELVVAAGLRYLGGSPYKDLVDIVGVSLSHTKTIVRKFLGLFIPGKTGVQYCTVLYAFASHDCQTNNENQALSQQT
jgi:hypothetical protein